MWKQTVVAALTLLVVTTAAAGGLPANGTANESPLADAGLDQTVTKGATVLLDGAGSRDPDGSIERYRWTIRTPDNRTITPDCVDCARTSFTPTEVGRYRVTLTVTDKTGATSTDTLYVDVSPGAKPTISLSGPEQPTEGNTATYTANLTAGSAALDYVVWTVDGVEVANHSLTPDQSIDTAMKQFPTAGSRTITATVYDSDGQSATGSLSVAVQRRSESPPQSGSPGSPPNEPQQSPRSGSTIADRTSPTVTGDAVVTGSEPLRGHYETLLDAAGEVTSVEWKTATGRVGHGRSLTRTWNPGDHQLYAVVTYVDGSSNVATFADGTTTVVADPKPNASIVSLDRYGSISGAVTGLDGYENLASLRVEVEGSTVATTGPNVRGRYGLDTGGRHTLHFSHGDFTPGEKYSVTVVTTDARGQTAKVSREVVPVKKPEVVRSEFVNGPVDSYHERIDPSRYAAHHVLEIDLNGVDPKKLNVQINSEDEFIRRLEYRKYHKKTNYTADGLIIHTYWAGEKPESYDLNVNMEFSQQISQLDWENKHSVTFQVTPSKPELRLDVVNDGTKDYITREHGILVNASGSFDPDGTRLKYIWKYGAEPTKPDNSTAKFRAYERAASIVEDQYDLRSKRNFNFLAYFMPDVTERDVLTTGPYLPNDTVRLQVKTEPYHFSKQTYYRDFSLGFSVSSSKVNILKWQEVKAPDSEHSDSTEEAYQYVATIEVPASKLSSSERPAITIYNEQNTRKRTQVNLPEVGVLIEDEKYWTNATVSNITYLVEKPRLNEITVDTQQARDGYLREGYQVKQRQETTEYVLEERIKVQNAEYETVTKTFSDQRKRSMFLQSTLQWRVAGTLQRDETQTRQYSKWYTESRLQFQQKWRDSNLWNGERTGKTQRILVEPAEYRTQRKYRYQYQVEKTGTKTVTRTQTIPITKTRTRTVTHCNLRFGCYKTTETYTYTTTRTYTYTTTKTYTYTVTKTRTYWATSKGDWTHTFTGRTRRVKVDEAVYERRYEVRYKTRYTETVTYYKVARDKQVQKARYEWQTRSTTDDYLLATRQASSRNDWRVTETTEATWVLVRRNGTRQFWTPVFENESAVVRTTATVTGNVTTQYYNTKTEDTIERIKRYSKQRSYEGAKNKDSILEIMSGEDEDENWCAVKASCSQR